jgi:hypothetical protein
MQTALAAKVTHPDAAAVLLDADLKLVAVVLAAEQSLLILVLAHELERVVLTASTIGSHSWLTRSQRGAFALDAAKLNPHK